VPGAVTSTSRSTTLSVLPHFAHALLSPPSVYSMTSTRFANADA
jgi:hypothetical protein